MIESIYIHIPFCKRICSYCDFCKVIYNDKIIEQYLLKLEEEIKNNYHNEKIKTIYIGGGTPSSLNIEQLKKLFNIINIIDKTNLKEFTIECNIEDIEESKLLLFKNNSINRISIGVQTFNKDILKLMNRNQNVNIEQNIKLIKKYFSNINIDLIYGFKEQTIENLKEDIKRIVDLDINHISTYSLMIEEHTKLYIDNYKKVDDDIDFIYYQTICNELEKNGFEHYEISNFKKEGFESLHNLCYWNNNKYYGFGLGAGGYIKDFRYSNTRSITNYLKGITIIEKEKITKQLDMEYEMILGLRKIEGVSKKNFFNKYNFKIDEIFDIIDMKNKGLIEENKDYIYIPKDKLYIENSILINFLGGSNERR